MGDYYSELYYRQTNFAEAIEKINPQKSENWMLIPEKVSTIVLVKGHGVQYFTRLINWCLENTTALWCCSHDEFRFLDVSDATIFKLLVL